jgi:hypothetical protein
MLLSDGVCFERNLTHCEIDGSGAQIWIGFNQDYSTAAVVSVTWRIGAMT